jgi:hypothetical protein
MTKMCFFSDNEKPMNVGYVGDKMGFVTKKDGRTLRRATERRERIKAKKIERQRKGFAK